MADSREQKDETPSKSPAGSKLDTLSRDDLLKFVKKQMVLLQKTRSKCEDLGNKLKEYESSSIKSENDDCDLKARIKTLESTLKTVEAEKKECLTAYNAVQQTQELSAQQIQSLEDECKKLKDEKELICQKFVIFEKKNKELMEELECVQMKDDTLTSTLHCMQEELEQLKNKNKELQTSLTNEDERKEQFLQDKAKLEDENTKFRDKLAMLESKIVDFQAKLEEKDCKLSEMSTIEHHSSAKLEEIEVLRTELVNSEEKGLRERSLLESDNKKLLEDLDSLGIQMKDLQLRLLEKDEQIHTMEEKLTVENENIKEQNIKEADLIATIETQNSELAMMTSRCEDLDLKCKQQIELNNTLVEQLKQKCIEHMESRSEAEKLNVKFMELATAAEKQKETIDSLLLQKNALEEKTDKLTEDIERREESEASVLKVKPINEVLNCSINKDLIQTENTEDNVTQTENTDSTTEDNVTQTENNEGESYTPIPEKSKKSQEFEAEITELLNEREEMEQELLATKQKLEEWDGFMQMLKDEKEQIVQELEEAEIREENNKKEMEFLMVSLQDALSERDEMKTTVKNLMDERDRIQEKIDKGNDATKPETYINEIQTIKQEKENLEHEKQSLNIVYAEKEKQLLQQMEDLQFQFEESQVKISCLEKEQQDSKFEITNLISKITELEQAVTDAASKVEERQKYVMQTESQIVELSNTLTQYKQMYGEVKDTVSPSSDPHIAESEEEQNTNTEQLLTKVQILEDNERKLKEEKEAIKSNIDDLLVKISDGEKSKVESEDRVKTVEYQLRTLEEENKELRHQLDTLQSANTPDSDIDNHINLVDSMQATVTALSSQVESFENEKTQLLANLEERQQQLLAVEAAMKTIQEEKSRLQDEKNETVNILEERNRDFINLEKQLQHAQTEFQTKTNDLSQNNNDLQCHIVELQNQLERLRLEKEEQREVCAHLNLEKDALLKEKTQTAERLESVQLLSEESISTRDKLYEEKKQLEDTIQQLEGSLKEIDLMKTSNEQLRRDYDSVLLEKTELSDKMDTMHKIQEENLINIEELTNKISTYENKCTALEKQVREKDTILSEMVASTSEKEEILLKQLEKENTELREKLQVTQKQVEEFEEKYSCCKSDNDQILSDLQCVKKELSDSTDTHQLDTNKISQLTEVINQLEECVCNLRKDNHEQSIHLNDLKNKQIEGKQESSDDMCGEVDSLKTTIKEKEEMCVKLKQLAIKSKKEATDIKSKMNSVSEEVTKLQNLIEEKDNQICELQKQLSQDTQIMKSSNSKLEADLTKCKEESEQMGADMRQMIEQLTDIKQQLEELKQVNDKLQKENDSYLVNIKEKARESEELKNQLNESRNELLATNIQIEEIKKEKQQCENKIKEDNDKHQQDMTNEKNKILSLEDEVKKLKNNLESAEKNASQSSMMDLEIADYERTVQTLNSKLTEREVTVSELNSEIERLNERAKALKEQIETVEEQRLQSEDRGNKLKQLLVKTKKELSDVKKQESEHRSSGAQLQGQMEHMTQLVEEHKMQVSEMAKENSRLQEKLRLMGDTNQRTVKSMESRVQQLQDDLDVTRSELTAVHAEFDSYKVRAHSVLKQQKTKSSDVNTDLEREEKLRLEKAVEQLKVKIQDSNDKLLVVQQDSDVLHDEYERLLQRHNKLLADMEEKEKLYNKRIEATSRDNNSSIEEFKDNIKQLTTQNESITKTFQDQIRSMQDEHNRAMSLLQKQCDSLDLENIKLQRDIQHRISRTTEHIEHRESPQDFLLEPHLGEERQEGEGSEIVEEPCNKSTVYGNKSSLSFEQLLSSSSSDNSAMIMKNSETVDLDTLQTNLTTAYRKVEHLTEVLNESEASVCRLTEQAKILKDEIRRLERNQEREQETKNLEYLKNILMKFLTPKSGERHQLIPVLTQMLKLSADEKTVLVKIAGETDEPAQTSGWGSYLHRWSGLS